MENPEKLPTQDTQDEEKEKKKLNTICVGYHYAQTKTNNENQTCALIQTTGGKDEPDIIFMRKSIQWYSITITLALNIGQYPITKSYLSTSNVKPP